MRNLDMFNLEDLRDLNWSLSRTSSGTAGAYFKSQYNYKGAKYYCKLSSMDAKGIISGKESYYEIIARNICNALNIECLQYDLIHALIRLGSKEYDTFLCRSKDFKMTGERKISMETYCEINGAGQEPLEFLMNSKFNIKIQEMFLLDFLIFNRDRHGANVEFLINGDGDVRMAPLFDNGISFFAPIDFSQEMMRAYDYNKCGPANNYLGSYDTRENLKYVNNTLKQKCLSTNILQCLFNDIPESCLTEEHKRKITKFIKMKLEVLQNET